MPSDLSSDPLADAGANSIGFTLDGTTPVALADWVQPSSNLNTGDQKGGYWSLHLNGVDHAAIAAVPEPGSVALMLAGWLDWRWGNVGVGHAEDRIPPID